MIVLLVGSLAKSFVFVDGKAKATWACAVWCMHDSVIFSKSMYKRRNHFATGHAYFLLRVKDGESRLVLVRGNHTTNFLGSFEVRNIECLHFSLLTVCSRHGWFAFGFLVINLFSDKKHTSTHYEFVRNHSLWNKSHFISLNLWGINLILSLPAGNMRAKICLSDRLVSCIEIWSEILLLLMEFVDSSWRRSCPYYWIIP